MVLTDTFARFSALRHPDRPVLFSTGTDEHGMKIQQAAAKGGMSEKEFCDEVSQRFRVSFLLFLPTSCCSTRTVQLTPEPRRQG